MGFTGRVNLQDNGWRRIQGPFPGPFFPRLLGTEEPPEELPQTVEITLIGNTAAMPLAVIKVGRVLVGRMGEQIQPQASAPVEFDFDIHVARHLVGCGSA